MFGAVLLISYLLGSIPFGIIITKLKGLPDLRTIGSGNIGATNVLRAANIKLAIIVWLLDMFKASLSVLISIYLSKHFNLPQCIIALAGLFAILGHCFPIWLKFKGGKGVSSLFGTILVINPFIFLISGILWLFVALISKYSSLGAIITFITLPLLIFLFDKPLTFVFIAISIICLYKHKSNIHKLISGTESKIKWKK